MLRSILVGLDGSDFSESAVELGIDWARRHNALLVGVGVSGAESPNVAGVPVGAATSPPRQSAPQSNQSSSGVAELLERFTRRCSNGGVKSEVIAATGNPAEAIMLEAQRFDLILMGQRTNFLNSATGFDDTLRDIVRHSPRPVVSIPEKLPRSTHVLIAYDGSVQAARTVQAYQALDLHHGGELTVISVELDEAEAARRAERAVEFLKSHDIPAVSLPLASQFAPAREILDHTEKLQAGLLVMGAYGKQTWREFFLGSTTQTVLRESTIPVLVCH
jgi:nucleotide-binding universal stress UspA family protein